MIALVKSHRRTLLSVVAGILIVAGLNGRAPARALERVTLNLNWFPVGDHAAYYVAKKLGLYERVGLDVNIVRGFGSADTVARVDAGSAEFGIADAPTTVVARGRGARVKLVAMIFDLSPFTMWTTKTSGIKTLKDLEGHTVGVPAGDAQRVFFPAVARSLGIDLNRVRFVNIKPEAKYAALGSGQVDAVFDFITGLPLWRQTLGDNYHYVRWADHGFDLYGNAIITTDRMVAEQPDRVRRFLQASLAGWQWTLMHPREAIDVLREAHPSIDPLAYLENLQLVIDLMYTPRFERYGIGYMVPERVARNVDIVETYIEGVRHVDPDDVYTNEFLTYYALPPRSRP